MKQSRCNGTILLVAVAIYAALATMTSDVKKPYGPKMCERLCNRIVGCSSYYIYRMSDLSCHVSHAILQNQEIGIYPVKDREYKEKMHAENAVNCRDGDQVFRTRSYSIKCRPRSYITKCRPFLPNLPTLTNKVDGTDGRMTRILMTSYSRRRKLPWSQLYLANNSVVTYPFLDSQYRPIAIAYIPSQRKLVMSVDGPNRIIFLPVDAKEKTVIKTKYLIEWIATDDEKQLMFMYSVISYYCIGAMTTYGKNLTLLFKLPCSAAHSFVADSNRSLIYILCRFKGILQFTYQGVPKGRVAEIDTEGTIPLYMHGDILYLQTKKPYALVQVSLSDHSVTKLPIKMSLIIRTLWKIGDLLYMFPFHFKGYISVVNMSDMGAIRQLNIGFAEQVIEIRTCLIP